MLQPLVRCYGKKESVNSWPTKLSDDQFNLNAGKFETASKDDQDLSLKSNSLLPRHNQQQAPAMPSEAVFHNMRSGHQELRELRPRPPNLNLGLVVDASFCDDDEPDFRSSHCTGAAEHTENLNRCITPLTTKVIASRGAFGTAAIKRVFID